MVDNFEIFSTINFQKAPFIYSTDNTPTYNKTINDYKRKDNLEQKKLFNVSKCEFCNMPTKSIFLATKKYFRTKE